MTTRRKQNDKQLRNLDESTEPRPAATRKGRSQSSRLIVGIGASAGGLNAFTSFFAQMPADSDMAFVVVQHLDPHHKSMLVDLLQRHTSMPVAEAGNGVKVVANRIFVIPPDTTLTIRNGTLRLTRPAPAREHRRPIDTFFASLAEDQGERAVCIVLSGTGSDGTLGLRAIKEHGGLTLAQAEFETTAMSGMPQSAAATGLVDHVMPVEEMPATLLEYRHRLLSGAERNGGDDPDFAPPDHLRRITALVRTATSHDFSQYKPSTLVRRIQRRMRVVQVDTMPDFIERLRNEPRQVDLLFREFLIGVTQFFRDPRAFDALQTTAVQTLLENRRAEDPVRVWVPGCATGEEVYSIAILLREVMERHAIPAKVQIFGTDIDDASVAIARTARYRKALTGVSAQRVERWFVADGEEYCPIKEIRDMCVFATHSLIRDPPFSKLSLISCRNVLIYMNADLQDRVIGSFHYALRPGGYLCLGLSEGITRNAKLFVAVNKKNRIFQRSEVPAERPPDFPPSAQAEPDLPGQATALSGRHLQDRIDHGARRVMEKYSPAYVVIDKDHEILRFSGGEFGRYLEPSPGRASLNLLTILRRGLRSTVREAVRKAYVARGGVATQSTIRIDGKSRSVKLIVEPIVWDGADAGLCVVALQDADPFAVTGRDDTLAAAAHSDVQLLEQELHTTKAQLMGAIDELETSAEEMKSANEEYQSLNEELQSSNEELETAKEEMQSINEELQTVNMELSSKNEILTRLNSDVKNLLDSTQIATIFLDINLRIKYFTPATADIFYVRDSDRGRPITEIAQRINYADLRHDVIKSLRELVVVEREVSVAGDSASLTMRIRPYRTLDNVVDGVVITFVDVSERRRFEEARLAAIVDSSLDAIIGHDFDGLITSWNAGAELIFEFSSDEAIGKSLSTLLPEDGANEIAKSLARVRRGEPVDRPELKRTTNDGRRIIVALTISPVKNANGTVVAASTVARDITKRKQAEEHQRLLLSELDHRVKNTLMTVTSLIGQTVKTNRSPEAFAEIVQGRIQALSRVHNLLTRKRWDRANLQELVEGELEPYRSDGNIIIEGPDDILLTPKATFALALALHELATNAAKYGALSVPRGQVRVGWRMLRADARSWLSLEWLEKGGPRVGPPTRRGFGSELIERTLVYELEADVKRDFEPDGLECRIKFPLRDEWDRGPFGPPDPP